MDLKYLLVVRAISFVSSIYVIQIKMYMHILYYVD